MKIKNEPPMPLDKLCVYFRVNSQHMSYVERLEMLYIYQKLAEWLNDTDVQRIIQEADNIRITLKIRGRQRSLAYVFQWCQAKAMKESGRYDINTKRLPVRPKVDRYY